ncbi:MAG: GNAT family N-acetyltransferase [Terrimonas sp.]|nr:GNAT family N-acetyltransferase [Terrimonas sp.]
MIYRTATTEDIPQIQVVRNAVTENSLSDPGLVTDKDCEIYIHQRGRGWVCELNHTIIGFAIADLQDDNIWALFVDPAFENQGIGKRLHDMMLDWYFSCGKEKVWLGTAPGTRAETFYRKAGWTETGMHGKGEIKFEMTKAEWERWKENNNNQ